MRSRLVVAAPGVACLGLTACGGGAGRARADAPATTARATASASRTCPHAVPADLAAPGPYAVRTASIALTRRASTSTQVRHIDPTAWFPAPGALRCRFAIVLFSHGHGGKPANYRRLLSHLASEGFVVVAPFHPDAGARGDEGAERVDDATYVLDHLRAIARRLAPGLPSELDTSRIAVAGHSFGAFVAAELAATDKRVRAALVMAGPLRPGPAASTRVPVLAMAGGADTLVPARLVHAYYAGLPAGVPHGYVQIAGASHTTYGTACAAQRTCGIVASYATSFLLTYLDALPGAGGALDPAAPRSSRVLLQTVGMPS